MSGALPWPAADAACKAVGLQLATVESAAQNALLVTAAAGNKVWTGGNDAASEGTWVWSPSNTPLSYTNWANGEPNNSGGREDCLEFRKDGTWNDERCDRGRKYVCQTACPVPPSPPPSPPSSPPPPPSPPSPPSPSDDLYDYSYGYSYELLKSPCEDNDISGLGTEWCVNLASENFCDVIAFAKEYCKKTCDLCD